MAFEPFGRYVGQDVCSALRNSSAGRRFPELRWYRERFVLRVFFKDGFIFKRRLIMKKPYYLTTAIAYSSAIPHIGNVYEAILADAIARFKRLDGYDVFFQTGTDEHGQKIETKAREANMEPRAYVDYISDEIKRIYASVHVDYDQFIRTTEEHHERAVQAIFKKLYDQGDIYLGKYEGWYSIAEESFVLEKDIVDGKGPGGDKCPTSEDAYFLKLTPYQDRLLEHIKHPEFIRTRIATQRDDPTFSKNRFRIFPFTDVVPMGRTRGGTSLPGTSSMSPLDRCPLSNYITGLELSPRSTGRPRCDEKYFGPPMSISIGKDMSFCSHTIYWPNLFRSRS